MMGRAFLDFSKNRRRKGWSWVHRRRWCAWAGLAAVLFQLLIPLGQGVSAAAFVQEPDGSALPFIICTAMGGVHQSSAEGHSNTPPGSSAPCAFCFVCQIRGLDISSPPVLAVRVLRPETALWVYPKKFDVAFKRAWTAIHARPRAPPFFV